MSERTVSSFSLDLDTKAHMEQLERFAMIRNSSHHDAHILRSQDKESNPRIFEASFDDMHRPDLSKRLFTVSKAGEFLDGVCNFEETGALDMVATARALGITLHFNKNLGRPGKIVFEGTEDERPLMTIGDEQVNMMRESFGHEVAHFFIEKKLGLNLYDGFGYHSEEAFCDYFGRVMALPDTALEDIHEVDEGLILTLAEKYEVEVQTVLLRLIDSGILPDGVAVDVSDHPLLQATDTPEVRRQYVCLQCLESRKKCESDGVDARLFDFTENLEGTSLGTCGSDALYCTNAMKAALTRYYQKQPRQLGMIRPDFGDSGQWVVTI